MRSMVPELILKRSTSSVVMIAFPYFATAFVTLKMVGLTEVRRRPKVAVAPGESSERAVVATARFSIRRHFTVAEPPAFSNTPGMVPLKNGNVLRADDKSPRI